MTGNPYHEPVLAAAINHVATVALIGKATKLSLLHYIDGADTSASPRLTMRRSIEIVMANVKMNEAMRKDLMRSLAMAREIGE